MPQYLNYDPFESETPIGVQGKNSSKYLNYDPFSDGDVIKPVSELNLVNANSLSAKGDSDFIPGIERGLQNLQSTWYGAGALVGGGLRELGAETVGKKLQDIGIEGYQRNVKEAEQYPKKFSFKDVYTGKAGIGGAIDWAQGTLGELIPSMAEAGIGALIGSIIAPGPGTAVGGLASRTVLKKGIDQVVKKIIKEGAEGLTESQIRKQVTKQALKTLGGKVGIGAAVLPMESGGMYADLFESHGVDAPGIALLFGSLSTSLEFFGGNSKLVDTFVDSLAKGYKGIAKRSAKELLTNIPQEALQEGGQELFSILNTVANTDEKLLTIDNVEQIVESMAAGAIGGGIGAATGTLLTGKEVQTKEQEDDKLINQRVENITSHGPEVINASIIQIGQDVDAIKTWLNDPQAVLKRTKDYGTTVEEVTVNLNKKLELSTKLQKRLMKEVSLESVDDQISKENVNVNPSDKQKEAGNYKKAPIRVNGLDIKIENPNGSFRSGTDKDGERWSNQMSGHYGYFSRTAGKDGDQVDVFIKPGTTVSPRVYIVDQVNPLNGKFDEHKVVMGANSEEEAKELYFNNYRPGWKGLGNITEMDQAMFKEWLGDSKRTKIPAVNSKEELIWKREEKEIKAQITNRENLQKRLKEKYDKIVNNPDIEESVKSSERQRLEQNQKEIDSLWKTYEETQAAKAQRFVPDSIDLAGQRRQQQIDNLYWPAEQELDERHNQEIVYLNNLKEKATTPDEKAFVDKLISDFQQRVLLEKEKAAKETVNAPIIEGMQPDIIDPNRQPDNFLTRATERLGGKVEPDVIFDKEKYRQEVLAEERAKAEAEASSFKNEQQLELGRLGSLSWDALKKRAQLIGIPIKGNRNDLEAAIRAKTGEAQFEVREDGKAPPKATFKYFDTLTGKPVPIYELEDGSSVSGKELVKRGIAIPETPEVPESDEYSPEQIAALKGTMINMPIPIEDKTENDSIDIDAHDAYMENTDQISSIESLMDCITGMK